MNEIVPMNQPALPNALPPPVAKVRKDPATVRLENAMRSVARSFALTQVKAAPGSKDARSMGTWPGG